MILPNDTKIQFCNAAEKLRVHIQSCKVCADYFHAGDGNLCLIGNEMIAKEMAYTDTTPIMEETK